MRRRERYTPFGSRPMSALPMIRDWRQQVRDDLLPELHGHQVQGPGRPELRHGPRPPLPQRQARRGRPRRGHARPASSGGSSGSWPTTGSTPTRSGRNWPDRSSRGWAGGPIVLILDETPNHNDLRCMKITLAYRKRALPLGCACYALGGQPEPMPELVVGLLRQVGRLPARGGRGHAPGRPRPGLAAGRRRLPRVGLALS